MSVWKRAYLYVIRKKVRSSLLFLLFFVSGLLLFTGISIEKSVGEAAGEFQKTLTTGLMADEIIADPFTVMDISQNEKGEEVIRYKVPFIMEKHIEEFLAIEGVSGFYCDSMEREDAYTGLICHPGYYTWCLGVADGTVPLEGDITEEFRDYMMEEQHLNATEACAHTNSFIQVYDSEWHPAFVNGAVELKEGRHIGRKDVGKSLISDELAERNGLNTGDKIRVQNADIFTGDRYGSVYETEVAGIFHINFEQTVTPDKTEEKDILANTFFSTPDIGYWSKHEYQIGHGMDVTAKESEQRLRTIVLFVENPMLLDSVKEQLIAIDSVDWSRYHLEIYDKDYQTAAAPLLSMMKIAKLLTVLPAVGVLMILSLVLTIWMRSRNYETGILFSVGVKKKTVLLQLLIECFSIAAAAFLAAFLLSGPAVRLAGAGLEQLFYSSGHTGGYEVVTRMGVTRMDINVLPPAKGDALSYAVAPWEACVVFLLLAGTTAVSVAVASVRMFAENPREILGKGSRQG